MVTEGQLCQHLGPVLTCNPEKSSLGHAFSHLQAFPHKAQNRDLGWTPDSPRPAVISTGRFHFVWVDGMSATVISQKALVMIPGDSQ